MHDEHDAFMAEFDITNFVGQQQQQQGASVVGANIAGSSSGGHINTGGGESSTPSSQLALHVDNNQHGQRQQQQQQALFNATATKRVMSGVEHGTDDRPMMGLSQNALNASAQVNLEALQQLLAMQMDGGHGHMQPQQQHQQPPQHGGTPVSMQGNTQALLEQQLRLNQLQQLQQLQNQIFQQQIELISGQSNVSNAIDNGQGALREQTQFHGLPTPANSTEIRAQPTSNYVSPMILQDYLTPPAATPLDHFSSPNTIPQGPSSAPAHIAFSQHHPADLDFDLEPLTSPWLAPYQQPDPSQHAVGRSSSSITPQAPRNGTPRSGTKRTASSSEDDASNRGQARKRPSPVVRETTNPNNRRATTSATRASGSTSLTSTPALRSRSRKNSAAEDAVTDTPSPVDLSASSFSTAMPPPAPPPAQQQQSSSQTSPAISPVTPASIMNLGRLGLSSGLSPPLNAIASVNGGEGSSNKSKAPARSKATSGSSTPLPAKLLKKASLSTSHIAQRPLLPGGLPPSSAAHLALHSNYTHHLSGSASGLNIAPSTPLPQPTLQVRKTSHKAAEQKRRDSLKTSFDSLRMLLPPIPLPTDEGYDGSPPLPGAMPPRGPPRGELQGPNRAVSKLQLLRCGNDYIRQLVARVERRNDYIDGLKEEIRGLRAALAPKEGEDSQTVKTVDVPQMDLEKDLDAVEADAPRLGAITEGEECEDDGDC